MCPAPPNAVVTDVQSFGQIVQGDGGGAGGVIRVKNGGQLTTSNIWTAVGYANNAHLIVETGGEANFGNHLWIGYFASSVGTLDINGGTVNVASMTGLGWGGGTGYREHPQQRGPEPDRLQHLASPSVALRSSTSKPGRW